MRNAPNTLKASHRRRYSQGYGRATRLVVGADYADRSRPELRQPTCWSQAQCSGCSTLREVRL